MRRIGEAIGAGGQQAGQAARQEAVLAGLVRGLDPEQHAGERTIVARQEQRLPGLRLEFRGLGKALRGCRQLPAHARPVLGVDEPDRNGRAARCSKSRMHESPRERPC